MEGQTYQVKKMRKGQVLFQSLEGILAVKPSTNEPCKTKTKDKTMLIIVVTLKQNNGAK